VGVTEQQLGAAPQQMAQGGVLVSICHREGDRFSLVSVAPSALGAHLAHGDVEPPCPATAAAAAPPVALAATATAFAAVPPPDRAATATALVVTPTA
jgi:hypothetical protein